MNTGIFMTAIMHATYCVQEKKPGATIMTATDHIAAAAHIDPSYSTGANVPWAHASGHSHPTRRLDRFSRFAQLTGK